MVNKNYIKHIKNFKLYRSQLEEISNYPFYHKKINNYVIKNRLEWIKLFLSMRKNHRYTSKNIDKI